MVQFVGRKTLISEDRRGKGGNIDLILVSRILQDFVNLKGELNIVSIIGIQSSCKPQQGANAFVVAYQRSAKS